MVVIPKWDRGIVKLVARSPESLVEFMTGMFILRIAGNLTTTMMLTTEMLLVGGVGGKWDNKELIKSNDKR